MRYNLSNQAVGAIMLALQRSLLELSDITPVLKNFEIEIDDTDELVIMNPPVVHAPEKDSPGMKMVERDETAS